MASGIRLKSQAERLHVMLQPLPLQLLKMQRAIPAPAKTRLDILHRSQRFHVDTKLYVRRLHFALNLLQLTVFKGQPGSPAQVYTLYPETAPAEIIHQAIEQSPGINVYIELAGELSPKKVLTYEGKTGELGGCSRLHCPARGLEQTPAIDKVQLGNVKMPDITGAIINAETDPGHGHARIGKPAPGQPEPGLQVLATGAGQVGELIRRLEQVQAGLPGQAQG